MSHYTGNHPAPQTPKARVAFIGGGILAAGFAGFYLYLHKRHERKHFLDGTTADQGRISTWESSIMQRGKIAPSDSSATLLASRVKARATPLPATAKEHDAKHRTHADDAGLVRNFMQPTAQKGHADGRGVYTKNPGWRESSHAALSSVVTDAKSGVNAGKGILEKAKDGVKGILGK